MSSLLSPLDNLLASPDSAEQAILMPMLMAYPVDNEVPVEQW